MPEGSWFYARGGQQHGPVDQHSLSELIRRHEVQASDFIWRDGMPDWLPAAQVPEFANDCAVANPGTAAVEQEAPPPVAPPAYGQPSPQPLAYGVPASNAGYYGTVGRSYASDAQTAMIVSIIGIVCFGIVLGPVGLALGISAKRKMRASGNMEGEGMATAAIVIGGIICGLMVLGLLLFVIAALAGAAGQ